MIQRWVRSLAFGFGVGVLVAAVWLWLGIGTKVDRQDIRPPAQPAAPSTGGAPDDVTVATSDTIVSVHTTTSSNPYVASVALTAMVMTSAWSLWRSRKSE